MSVCPKDIEVSRITRKVKIFFIVYQFIGKKKFNVSVHSGRSGQLENYFSWEIRNCSCDSPAYQSLSTLNLISYCCEVTTINTPSLFPTLVIDNHQDVKLFIYLHRIFTVIIAFKHRIDKYIVKNRR